jgi:hypothetical protein
MRFDRSRRYHICTCLLAFAFVAGRGNNLLLMFLEVAVLLSVEVHVQKCNPVSLATVPSLHLYVSSARHKGCFPEQAAASGRALLLGNDRSSDAAASASALQKKTGVPSITSFIPIYHGSLVGLTIALLVPGAAYVVMAAALWAG